MNYQVSMMKEPVLLNVGEIIRDERSGTTCSVKKVGENFIEFSDVRYSHPYDLTLFVLKLFKNLKKSTGVKKIMLKTGLGIIEVDNKSTEGDMYNTLMEIRSNLL